MYSPRTLPSEEIKRNLKRGHWRNICIYVYIYIYILNLSFQNNCISLHIECLMVSRKWGVLHLFRVTKLFGPVDRCDIAAQFLKPHQVTFSMSRQGSSLGYSREADSNGWRCSKHRFITGLCIIFVYKMPLHLDRPYVPFIPIRRISAPNIR